MSWTARIGVAVLAVAVLPVSTAAAAAAPRAGTWYGSAGDEGAVLFDVKRSGGDAVIRDIHHWEFGRTCRGVDSTETGGSTRTRLVVGADGRFRSAIAPGTKVAFSGRAEGSRIRIKVWPAQGTKAERRCFTRRFTARPAAPARLRSGRWRGTVAAQPAVDSFSGPEPAQPFDFRVAERGRVFAGGGGSIRVGMRCESEREPSKGFTTDLFDLSRPIEPDGTVAYRERRGADVQWTLTATSETTVEGTVRVRDTNSRGDACDSGDIAITAARG